MVRVGITLKEATKNAAGLCQRPHGRMIDESIFLHFYICRRSRAEDLGVKFYLG